MQAESLHYLTFLPAQVLATTLAAFDRWSSISCAAVTTDFHIQPVLLRDGFLEWISNRHGLVNSQTD